MVRVLYDGLAIRFILYQDDCTWPGRGAPGQHRDGHQDRAGLLPPAVRGHDGQDVAAGLGGGQRGAVPDDALRADAERLLGAGDAVLADLTEGGRAVLVPGLDLDDVLLHGLLLHLAAVLLLTPLRDVLVHVLHHDVNIHTENKMQIKPD